MVTYDILKHYCELKGDMQELILSLDEPQNAFLLSRHARSFFDYFTWCLVPTEVCFLAFTVEPSNLTLSITDSQSV